MDQVVEFFRKIFDSSDWPPRWHCGKWTEFHGWLYVVSDLLIWSAYFAIPIIILRYISKRRDARFHKIYFLFAAFILACGSTHFLDAVTFWIPVYRFNALVRFVTGVISWTTVFFLIRMLPQAFSLKSQVDLEKEVERRTAMEAELRKKNDQLLEAQDIAKLGNWEWDVSTNKLYWSEGLYKMYGFAHSDDLTYDKFIAHVHPDDRSRVHNFIRKALKNKIFPDYYHRVVMPEGQIKIMHARGELVFDGKGEIVKMIGTGQDVTEQKKAEQDLLSKTEALEAANVELQKFAYVASHDLQEPLRKIITFTSLLHKDLAEAGYQKKDNRLYMEKIISSSFRMQRLINDILNFSKLNEGGNDAGEVNLDMVLQQVLSDMEVLIESTGAKIHSEPLPEIEGNTSQMGQLFQNLLSNAIKFRRNGVDPRINIRTEQLKGSELQQEETSRLIKSNTEDEFRQTAFCKIYVSDNGIGFDESFLDRIFVIFQRLHGKLAYEGTGIGLAICKRIVDNHHGMITATSKPGEGSSFIILLPILQRNYG